MRFCALAFTALVPVNAFTPQRLGTGSLFGTGTRLFEAQHGKEWWGPAATTIAGVALLSQVASASIPADQVAFQGQPPAVLLTIGASIQTLDFSLPSYDDAVKSEKLSVTTSVPPSFNPFGDSFNPFGETEAQAESKAEQAAIKAEQKAEQKAAAEAEKAAKKAEKESRRLEELEKQKAAAERSKQDQVPRVEEPIPSEAEAEAFSFKMPEIKAPDISMPDFKAPEMPQFSMPKVDMPNVDMPKIPSFGIDMPKFGGFSMPKVEMPSMPKVDMPSMPQVDMPKVDMPLMPKVEMPAMPELSLPDMPKIELPSLPNPFGGGKSRGQVAQEPQEVRDQRARDARKDFLQADDDARAAEEAARQVRDRANEKLKLAKLAKDEACQTRWGGKWICLRNPFTAGF